MRIEVKYESLKDRTEKINENETMGLRMLTDTFDSDWKRGDEPHGIMIFTDEPSPVVELPVPGRDLSAEIDALKIRLEVLESKK